MSLPQAPLRGADWAQACPTNGTWAHEYRKHGRLAIGDGVFVVSGGKWISCSHEVGPHKTVMIRPHQCRVCVALHINNLNLVRGQEW